MADMGRWFKLWCSCLRDPGLGNLSMADFGRWAKLGVFIKEQGTGGRIVLEAPAKTVCNALDLVSFSDLVSCVQRLHQVNVSSETSTDVSLVVEYRNWPKYQGDFSTDRVHRFREKSDSLKRSKRRGEEKRGEEKRTTPPQPPAWAQDLVSKWNQAAEQSRKGNPPGLHAVDPEITKKRLRLLHLRWKDLSSDPEWWSQVFARLASSRFACGRHEGKNGGAPWRASFDWVLANDTNAVKVTEGRYDG